VGSYERLEAESRRPAKVTDHSAAWSQLEPIGSTNGSTRERVECFCAEKRITLAALEALGTRVRVDRHGGVELAWGYPAQVNGRQVITALKFRPLGDKERYAANPSVFIEPIVVGNRDSLDWFLAEGETDTARLFELVGDVAAVMLLPAGAATIKIEWAKRIPRGATVHLCHDADEAGDAGAKKAAAMLGGRVIRVRPPEGYKDFCEWEGGREEFVELVAKARAAQGNLKTYEFMPLADFLAHPFPQAEPLLGEPGAIYLAKGTLLLVYGSDGAGKSTLTVDGIAHLAAGRPWLGIPVPRPVRFCMIENEGPPSLFQQKLAAKAASWDGRDWSANLHVFQAPWGEFTFADPETRAALNAYCDEHEIDVVTANPTLGLGVAASGRPDETQQFVEWLKECGLASARAFWLLHHENKAGQISGDWGRHPDTKVQLQQDGNRPRTKLVWEKTRWATLPSEGRPKACVLEWVTETKGYRVVDIEPTTVDDAELARRLDEYLDMHPFTATRTVIAEVQGGRERLRALLDTDRYDSVKGPQGARRWRNAPTVASSSDATEPQ
jgi:AAA domain